MIRVLLLFSFLFTINTAFPQQIQTVLEKMDETNRDNPQEKIYLHLDKYSYTAGESIWFKAYTTIGIHNLFSKWSNIGYVELIDPTEKVVKSIKIPLINGIGIGDLALTDTLTEGSYRVRAYTNWMRNYEDKYFYDRTIQISNGRIDNVLSSASVERTDKEDIYSISLTSLHGVPLAKTQVRYELVKDGGVISRKRTNTDEKGVLKIGLDKKSIGALINLRFENLEKISIAKTIKPINPESKNSVQLFAEGGKILAGKLNNIAVKAINPKGLGVKAKVVVASERDTITVIETNSLGMGSSFVFIDPLQKLHARAYFEDGTQLDVDLPELVQEGYSILVNNQIKDKITAQVSISDKFLDQNDTYFVVHHLGHVLFVSKQKASKNELVFNVAKKDLPSGVITITILNSQLLPVVERAVFHFSDHEQLDLKVNTSKNSYSTREEVKVDIEAGDGRDSLRLAALSASVLNLSKISDDYSTEANILSTLLLSSDVKGFIEKPGYYFENGKVKLSELDYLMLTQGWRDINWDSIGLTAKPKFEPEKGIKISGYTKKLGRKAPEKNANVQLISTQSYMDYIDTISNEEGYFEFDELMFPDSIKFLVSARDDKGKNNIDIIMNTFEEADVSGNRNAALEINGVNELFLDQINQSKLYFSQLEQKGLMEKTLTIEEVVVRATAKKKVAENSSNLNGPGNADQIITSEDLATCFSIEMCLAGRLVGVRWQAGVPYSMRGNGPMQIVLDGMFIEPDQISMINMIDIESVEVLRSVGYTAIYGMNGGNGLIIFTSKIGSSAMRSYVPKGILTIQPQGIHTNKIFYAPKYNVDADVQLAQDLRTTIHWEPGIVTDEHGKASFDFFTSDETGKYLMIVEGLDLQGRIARKLVEIEVK